MRGVLLALLLAACGGPAGSGPAWPKSAISAVDPDKPEEDGGESLEPHHAEAVAAVEASTATEPEPAVTAAGPTAAIDPAKPDQPATPGTTPVEEPAIEEIVIEINGD